ncbi:MAG: HPr(Ser) kinase/phosphatase [Mycoplasmoidaceae bacterium]
MDKINENISITWKDIDKNFEEFKVINIGRCKDIRSTRMSRVGLELSGYFARKESFAAILFGRDEYNYLLSFDEATRNKKINDFFKLEPPVIILSRSFNEDIILDAAKKYDIALIKSNQASSYINTSTNLFLIDSLSKYESIHGNLVEVYGIGVLLIGESGLGKSEITLELIKKGHLFIADDVVEYKQLFSDIVGRPNKKTGHFIEVRGLGILNINKLYGIQVTKKDCKIDVVVELKTVTREETFERLGKEYVYKRFFNIDIPHYKIPISPGRQIGDIIEAIVGDFKLKKSGYFSTNEFLKKMKEED